MNMKAYFPTKPSRGSMRRMMTLRDNKVDTTAIKADEVGTSKITVVVAREEHEVDTVEMILQLAATAALAIGAAMLGQEAADEDEVEAVATTTDPLTIYLPTVPWLLNKATMVG